MVVDRVGLMILTRNGLFLAVSRKDDQTKFGFAGGKTEMGEDAKSAAIRETFEETGLTVKDCRPVYSSDGCVCFLATDWEGIPSSREAGLVSWERKESLTKSDSAFPEYNRLALQALESMM